MVSLLTLQGVNDLPGALIQMRRALRPDGLLLACLFAGATLSELRSPGSRLKATPQGRRAVRGSLPLPTCGNWERCCNGPASRYPSPTATAPSFAIPMPCR